MFEQIANEGNGYSTFTLAQGIFANEIKRKKGNPHIWDVVYWLAVPAPCCIHVSLLPSGCIHPLERESRQGNHV